ncbi:MULTISPECIES: thioredoxin family protein [Niastella]|uniref:Thioredoxin family protein n=1 Tax=Niastella soli TaxID=2821487 RepID=A0ABS3Z379_9BACT|nr:thioredoxin family protein [Niastella soli]MBO9204619.1 thioredoxin family protein [Niastella soli]
MKQRMLSFWVMLIPVFSFSQGIQWANGLSWEQVRQKAKEENKYIFLDVYATWCGPCKLMDQDVYPLAEVGKVFNDKFISIRVQADRSTKDAEAIKSRYEDAEKINSDYKVGAFPTFLFFAPSGELVHRASGGFNVNKFISLANDALGQKGYIKQIELFKAGQYENLDLRQLAIAARYAGDASLAKAIATTYVQNLDAKELIKQDNLYFVFEFAEQEQDRKWAKEVCTPKIKSLSMEDLASTQAIRFLIYAAKDDSLAAKATDIWISKMTDSQLFNKDTLEYVRMFLHQSSDKSFQVLYKNARRVDKIMGKKDWTVDALSNVISNQEFGVPTFNPAWKAIKEGKNNKSLTDPDWNNLNYTIAKKYGSVYAEWLQFSPKISWYNLIGNKKEYITNLVAEMNRTGGWGFNGMVLNNSCMEVFLYGKNKKELQNAAAWMEMFFKRNPKEIKTNAVGLDTYAILLYKAGQVKESLQWEEKATQIDPNNSEIANNFAKMKNGLPIWPVGFDVVN